MKLLSSILFISILAVSSAIGQNKVQLSIDQFVHYQGLEQASISFQVLDLETGKSVASHDPNRTMATASTAKLFSTATALEILGENYRPKTRVYADGDIDSTGALMGNIWIRGGGDPSLGSKYFTNKSNRRDFLKTWADSLLAEGIHAINGSVIGDASEFGYKGAPDGWSWVDMGNYYGAGPSGLSIFDNLVEFKFKVPNTLGATSKISSISPAVPNMTFHNYVKSSSRTGDNAYFYGAPYSLDRFVTGELPRGSSAFVVKGSLPDPEYQFAYEFAQVLQEKGIKVLGEIKTARSMEVASSNKTYAQRNLLITHKGQSIGRLIDKTNERSINLFAEHLTCLVGYVKNGNGSTDSGLREVEKYWATKFTTTGMHVNDGSGLSRMNAISANHFTGLLRTVRNGKNGTRFNASLPVAGVSGTMRNICKGQSAHNRMSAKSGSMTRIKSYAGYIKSTSGKQYVFALIVNNQSCSSRVLINKMEVIFNKIATL
tara:strand:+ start:2670 stop:4133 length:1464 start_codon:yes stop_codon:yes gene_type:complete